jgi:hypothetical protein
LTKFGKSEAEKEVPQTEEFTISPSPSAFLQFESLSPMKAQQP